jgi:hypothetical protein
VVSLMMPPMGASTQVDALLRAHDDVKLCRLKLFSCCHHCGIVGRRRESQTHNRGYMLRPCLLLSVNSAP